MNQSPIGDDLKVAQYIEAAHARCAHVLSHKCWVTERTQAFLAPQACPRDELQSSESKGLRAAKRSALKTNTYRSSFWRASRRNQQLGSSAKTLTLVAYSSLGVATPKKSLLRNHRITSFPKHRGRSPKLWQLWQFRRFWQ